MSGPGTVIACARLLAQKGEDNFSTHGWLKVISRLEEKGKSDDEIVAAFGEMLDQPHEFERFKCYGIVHLEKFFDRIRLCARDRAIIADLEGKSQGQRAYDLQEDGWLQMARSLAAYPRLRQAGRIKEALIRAGCQGPLAVQLEALMLSGQVGDLQS